MDKENGAEEATTSNSGASEQNQHNENQKNNARVPFYKLFSFVDSIDKALMIIGSIGAVANGVCMPLMAIIIGELVDSFEVACRMVTGERQATRLRKLYLKAIPRQDIAFFDKETNIGEVIGRMSGDTVLIQDAMGEKVGKFLK